MRNVRGGGSIYAVPLPIFTIPRTRTKTIFQKVRDALIYQSPTSSPNYPAFRFPFAFCNSKLNVNSFTSLPYDLFDGIDSLATL